MISSIISRLVILVFGTLYPAYASYKAVRTKNVKEYVKWMMYWIVFALFTCAETFTDVFCSFWFPFYYEFKVILVLWLLSPATKGSSILYRKFVHPMLTKREQEIDEYIAKAKEQGYHTVLTLGSKGVNYATTVIMQTAIKGGGGLVNQLRRSYSLSDISADMEALAEMNRIKALPEDELDLGDTPMPKDPRLKRTRGYSPRRSASGSGRVEMYFPEVDVNVRQRGTRPREPGIPLSHIRSNEDVSSGYSSAEMLYSGHPPTSEAQEPLVRTSSVGSSRVTRTKVARGGAVPKRPTAAEDNLSWSESESEEPACGTEEEYFYDVPPAAPYGPVDTLPSTTLSQSVPSHLLTGSDFKHHLPVALECDIEQQPQQPIALQQPVSLQQPVPLQEQEPVVSLVSEEPTINKEAMQNVIDTSSTGLLEEHTNVVISHVKEEDERGLLVLEKSNIQDETSLEGEFKTVADNSTVLSDINNDLQTVHKETPASDNEVPVLVDLKNNEVSKSQDIDPISKLIHSDEVVPVGEENPNAKTGSVVSQEVDDAEFFDTESNMIPQNPIAVTGLKKSLLSELEFHNLLLLNGVGLDSQSLNKASTCVNEVPLPNTLINNDKFKSLVADFIPITVLCEEGDISIPKIPKKNLAQELEDSEFFDTETDLQQNTAALNENSNVPPVTSECFTNENQNKDRVVECDVQKEAYEMCKENSNVVPVISECFPNENQNDDRMVECDVQKETDEMCKDGRAGRYRKHHAPSPPQKSSADSSQLSVNKDEVEVESNLSHELRVPDQKSPSPKRDRSGSKSPRCSPSVHKKSIADDRRELKTNATSTESVTTHSPLTAPYTEELNMRPSEYYYNQYRAQGSPNQPRKETKSKQDTRFFSRILAKPRSQLASFFPFFSTPDEPKPLSDSLTTSLTSLGDMRNQDRARSSSMSGVAPTSSAYMAAPPELPPRRRTPDQSGATRRDLNIREMSHSPPRRFATSN